MADQLFTAEPTLHPTTLKDTFHTTLEALPHSPHATEEAMANRREAAVITLGACRPRDALEANLAARIVASHYAAMENFRCATQDDLPAGLKLRFAAKACQMSRLSDSIAKELSRRQGHPAVQPIMPLSVAPAQAVQPAAASPSQPAPQAPATPRRAAAAPAVAATQPAPQPGVARQPEKPAASLRGGLPGPHSAGAARPAPLTAAEAARDRMLEGFVARPTAPAISRAA